MEIDRSVIDKIKKLLIKHDGCKKIKSESEAEVALNLAFSLMRKHHLTMSTVLTESATGNDEIFIIEKQCEKYIANVLPVWLQNIIQMINVLCNTECILRKYKTNRSAKQLFINFIGETKDVEKCIDTYKFFKGVTMKLAREHQKRVKGTFTQWRSYSEGFTGRLLEKAIFNKNEIDAKIEKIKRRDSGLQKIDDIEEDDSDISENEEPENQTFEVKLYENELISINKYQCYIKTKIKEFLEKEKSKRENLKESTKIDSESFYQGRLAANQYDISNSTKKKFLLT